MENAEKKEWVPKNWGTFVTFMAVGLVAGVIVYFISVSKLLKESDLYRDAASIAADDKEVAEAIGSPVTADSMFITGDLTEEGDSGSASMIIPLSGPKGSADLFVVAYKSGGKWEYKKLLVKLRENEKQLNLLKE